MNESQNSQIQPTVNRREALKALAAAGGALAAGAFLPARWSRPVVEAGVLPAHAQGSLCTDQFTIAACSAPRVYWWPAGEGYMLNAEYRVEISPACDGVMLCYDVRFLAGEQDVPVEWAPFCGQTVSGKYTSGAAMGEAAFFALQPTPTRMGFVVGFENPELGQGTCSAFGDIPPYPEA